MIRMSYIPHISQRTRCYLRFTTFIYLFLFDKNSLISPRNTLLLLIFFLSHTNKLHAFHSYLGHTFCNSSINIIIHSNPYIPQPCILLQLHTCRVRSSHDFQQTHLIKFVWSRTNQSYSHTKLLITL